MRRVKRWLWRNDERLEWVAVGVLTVVGWAALLVLLLA
jgi:hypothetical protein